MPAAAAEAAVTAQMRAAARQEGAGKAKPAPALSAGSEAAPETLRFGFALSPCPAEVSGQGHQGEKWSFHSLGKPPRAAQSCCREQGHPNIGMS